MTYGSLRCEISTLEPDDHFVDQLAELAAASLPTRGGVLVPVAFGGPAGRAVVIAAAVAAVTAGAAAAATHLSDARHDEPAPPGRSVGIHRPDGPAPARAHHRDTTTSGAHDTLPAAQHPAPNHNVEHQPPTAADPAQPTADGPDGTGPVGGNDPGNDPGDDHHGDHQSTDPGDGTADGDSGDSGGDTGGGDTGGGDTSGDTSGGDSGDSGDSGGDTSAGDTSGGGSD